MLKNLRKRFRVDKFFYANVVVKFRLARLD